MQSIESVNRLYKAEYKIPVLPFWYETGNLLRSQISCNLVSLIYLSAICILSFSLALEEKNNL